VDPHFAYFRHANTSAANPPACHRVPGNGVPSSFSGIVSLRLADAVHEYRPADSRKVEDWIPKPQLNGSTVLLFICRMFSRPIQETARRRQLFI
jgi:hypothetical protein